MGVGCQVVLPENSASILELQDSVSKRIRRDQVCYLRRRREPALLVIAKEKSLVVEDRSANTYSLTVVLKSCFPREWIPTCIGSVISIQRVGVIAVALVNTISISRKNVRTALFILRNLCT